MPIVMHPERIPTNPYGPIQLDLFRQRLLREAAAARVRVEAVTRGHTAPPSEPPARVATPGRMPPGTGSR